MMAGAECQWRGWARVGTWHARYRRSWGRPGGEPGGQSILDPNFGDFQKVALRPADSKYRASA